MTLPGKKHLYRFYDNQGNFFRDGILLESENPDLCKNIHHPNYPEKLTPVGDLKRELIHQVVYKNGVTTNLLVSPFEINNFLQSRAAHLPEEHKRFIMPHIYKVGISANLLKLRDDLRNKVQRNTMM